MSVTSSSCILGSPLTQDAFFTWSVIIQLGSRLSTYSFHCIKSIVFLFVFTTFVYFPSLEFVPSHIHCIPSCTRINLTYTECELRPYVIRKERESHNRYKSSTRCGALYESARSRAMAMNTAPQWLKNTGVFDHSTLYLLDLCVVALCILSL